MLFHQLQRVGLVLEEHDVAQLIDLVKADHLNAHKLLQIGHVRLRAGKAGDTRARQGDLGGGGIFNDHVGVAVLLAQAEDVVKGDEVAVKLVDAVGIVPHQQEIRRGGLHRS